MTTIYSANVEDFQRELVGQRIVTASKDTIVLESGTVLTLEDTSDCCAWFSATDIEMIDTSDNVVTEVTAVDLDDADEYSSVQHYRVNILSNAKEIANFEIKGDPTSGYYCHSINLIIKKEN